MRKILFYTFTFLFLCFWISACSNGGENEQEKGAIEKMTERTVHDMVEKIQTPIDRAKNAKETEEDRAKKMDEIIKEQD